MTDPPNLDLVNLVVSDMEATVAFYRRLGLTIPDTDAVFQNHHRAAEDPGGVDFHFDSTEFAHHWARGWTTGARVVVGFKAVSRERVDAIYADLTGAPRPKADRATAGTRWCKPWNDFPAARGSGVSPAEWVTWTLRCESKSVLSWRDPMPTVRSTLHRLLASRASAGAKNLKPQDWIGL